MSLKALTLSHNAILLLKKKNANIDLEVIDNDK